MRYVRVLAAAALVAIAGTVSAATPAQAVTGLAYVYATSALDSSALKTLTLSCAAGKVAIGGGAFTLASTWW